MAARSPRAAQEKRPPPGPGPRPPRALLFTTADAPAPGPLGEASLSSGRVMGMGGRGADGRQDEIPPPHGPQVQGFQADGPSANLLRSGAAGCSAGLRFVYGGRGPPPGRPCGTAGPETPLHQRSVNLPPDAGGLHSGVVCPSWSWGASGAQAGRCPRLGLSAAQRGGVPGRDEPEEGSALAGRGPAPPERSPTPPRPHASSLPLSSVSGQAPCSVLSGGVRR